MLCDYTTHCCTVPAVKSQTVKNSVFLSHRVHDSQATLRHIAYLRMATIQLAHFTTTVTVTDVLRKFILSVIFDVAVNIEIRPNTDMRYDLDELNVPSKTHRSHLLYNVYTTSK